MKIPKDFAEAASLSQVREELIRFPTGLYLVPSQFGSILLNASLILYSNNSLLDRNTLFLFDFRFFLRRDKELPRLFLMHQTAKYIIGRRFDDLQSCSACTGEK